jgi:hypothetical protein
MLWHVSAVVTINSVYSARLWHQLVNGRFVVSSVHSLALTLPTSYLCMSASRNFTTSALIDFLIVAAYVTVETFSYIDSLFPIVKNPDKKAARNF